MDYTNSLKQFIYESVYKSIEKDIGKVDSELYNVDTIDVEFQGFVLDTDFYNDTGVEQHDFYFNIIVRPFKENEKILSLSLNDSMIQDLNLDSLIKCNGFSSLVENIHSKIIPF